LSSMIRKQLRESFFLGVFALVTVCLLSPSASAIKISDNFSVDGFLDMSAGVTIGEDEEGESELDAFAGYDQLELALKFSFDKLSGRADIDGNDSIGLEQAYITYAFSDMVSINAGRFLCSLGFEAAEPTDMFQYSYSTGIPYPGYQNGVSLSISPSDMIGLYAAVVTGVWDGGGDTDLNHPGFEAQVALMPIEGLTAKIGFAGDIMEEVHAEEEGVVHDHDDDEDETYLKSEINAWVMYSMDNITVAAEFDFLPNYYARDANGIHFLAMANIGITDEIGVTVRFSGAQDDLDNDDEELRTSFTISPSYAFNDNLGSLIELKQILGDEGETQIAFETIMTF
jgi:hypothetical protein